MSIAAYITAAFYLTDYWNFRPNVVSLLMTMAGLFIILTQQLSDASKFCSHKPNTFAIWVKSFPSGKPITVSVEGVCCAVMGGKARVTVSIAADSSIERKVDFLMRQYAALDTTIANMDDKIDEVKTSLNKADKQIKESLDENTKALNSIIASHIVGTYDLNLFGINVTMCGAVIQFFNS